MEYRELNDQEMLTYIAEADEYSKELLFQKYEPLIYAISKKMLPYCKNSGLELNDLMQEGRLGLNTAMERYDKEQRASFYTFAKTCIERRVITLTVSTRRLKHRALNESISLEISNQQGEIYSLEALLGDEKSNPEAQLIHLEQEQELFVSVKNKLTDFEGQVFELKINDFTNREIAHLLGKDYKAVDNALQRIRGKIKIEKK